jgi:integrase
MSEALAKILAAPANDRLGLPITYVMGPDGERHVLSRYGDARIDMLPYLKNPAAGARFIDMTLYPERWRKSVLDLLIAFWHHGRPGHAAPKASTVINKAVLLVPIIRWLEAKGVGDFRGVRPLHMAAFVESSRTERGQVRKAGTTAGILGAVGLAWDLRDRIPDAIEKPPFGERGKIGTLAKLTRCGSAELVTEALSEVDASKLVKICEDALLEIEGTLVDYEEIEAYKIQHAVKGHSKSSSRDVYWSMPHLYGRWSETERRINDARAACFTLIGLLTGMRLSELLLLESGCYFESDVQGQRVGWIRGKTLKMRPDGAEATEWIAPPRVAELLAVMDRIVAPVRVQMRREIVAMERELAEGCSEDRRLYLLQRVQEAGASLNRLFLSSLRNIKKAAGGSIRGAGRGSAAWISRMVKKAGLEVRVHPHMLRRTYAVMVVLQCAGDLRYLRKQFQHWSIETTQLYATHAMREQELIDEVADEMLTQKVGLITHWLMPNTILAGLGGEHIAAQRQKPEYRGLVEADLKGVAKHLSDGLVLRATGHSWCVSTPTPSCGGQGLYDATYCARCDSAVITEEKRSIWEILAQQMLEVRQLGDSGAAGQQLVERSLEAFDAILKPLGSSVDLVAKTMRRQA